MRVKFGLKIPNRFGKKCQKKSWGISLTHTVYLLHWVIQLFRQIVASSL